MTNDDGPFWADILQNPQQRFYIGSTKNLARRIREHNDPTADASTYTRKNGPWKLVWSESHPTRAAARQSWACSAM
ncbi:MAG: GIY-YIG nuclease family protein [Phycisphaerales bacterium JB038]